MGRKELKGVQKVQRCKGAMDGEVEEELEAGGGVVFGRSVLAWAWVVVLVVVCSGGVVADRRGGTWEVKCDLRRHGTLEQFVH